MHNYTSPSLPNKSDSLVLRSFRENLGERMEPEKLYSLQILGENFFYLVDRLSSELYVNFNDSAALLELTDEDYLWELQIFVNKFIRICSESPENLIQFCRELRSKLDVEGFNIEFHKMLNKSFQDHFFFTYTPSSLLV